LAGELLAEYGSLIWLARASLANLRRFLLQTKSARLVAALRLGKPERGLVDEEIEINVPQALLVHHRQDSACDVHLANEARRQLPLRLLRRQLLEVARVKAGSIVDQRVEPALGQSNDLLAVKLDIANEKIQPFGSRIVESLLEGLLSPPGN
jgi:hypothetical protein